MAKKLWSNQRIRRAINSIKPPYDAIPSSAAWLVALQIRNDYERRIAELERATAEPSMEQMLVEIDAVTGDVDDHGMGRVGG